MKHQTLEVLPRENTYRDELNFAEFPLATLADSLPSGQKTLEFTDEIFDEGRRQLVKRKVTISASDKYGLPSARDDEIVLGLIQLTHRRNFASPKVTFRKRELIEILGWRDESESYRRIEESLKRWIGVTLYYDKAWWSRQERCWVDKSFHIIEELEIYDRERQRLAGKRDLEALSHFTWNPTVFESFKAGCLKQLNLELYKELKSDIAKRMYRFLDKRFYLKRTIEFELQEFAFEHLALSRSYTNAQIKRRLERPLAELEEHGFLKPLSESERYEKVRYGVVKIRFVSGGAGRVRARVAPVGGSEVECLLRERGIGGAAAGELASGFDEQRIREKVQAFDALVRANDKRVSKNPPGFLYKAIVDDYKLEAKAPPERPRKAERGVISERQINRAERDEHARKERLSLFLEKLTPEEARAFEESAIEAANPFLRKQYFSAQARGGVLFETVRQQILFEALESGKN